MHSNKRFPNVFKNKLEKEMIPKRNNIFVINCVYKVYFLFFNDMIIITNARFWDSSTDLGWSKFPSRSFSCPGLAQVTIRPLRFFSGIRPEWIQLGPPACSRARVHGINYQNNTEARRLVTEGARKKKKTPLEENWDRWLAKMRETLKRKRVIGWELLLPLPSTHVTIVTFSPTCS